MKKTLTLILTLVILASTFIPVNASENTENTYIFGNVTVQFDDDCTLPDKQKEVIAYQLANGENCDDTSTYNLWCTLFGHNYGSPVNSKVITHCVNANAPRCVRKTYQISTCTRCDETKTSLISSADIYCCP